MQHFSLCQTLQVLSLLSNEIASYEGMQEVLHLQALVQFDFRNNPIESDEQLCMDIMSNMPALVFLNGACLKKQFQYSMQQSSVVEEHVEYAEQPVEEEQESILSSPVQQVQVSVTPQPLHSPVKPLDTSIMDPIVAKKLARIKMARDKKRTNLQEQQPIVSIQDTNYNDSFPRSTTLPDASSVATPMDDLPYSPILRGSQHFEQNSLVEEYKQVSQVEDRLSKMKQLAKSRIANTMNTIFK